MKSSSRSALGNVRLRESAAIACGGVSVATAVLAVGGALRGTAAAVAILVAISLIPIAWSRRGLVRLSPLVATLAVAIVLTALQLLPLPDSWVEALSPTHETLRSDGTKIAGVSEWSSTSMDTAGSLRSLTFFVTL